MMKNSKRSLLLLIIFISCSSLSIKDRHTPIDKKDVLQYPVVLVHGIVAQDRKSVISFWGRIPKVLTEYGIDVYFGNTDAWGDYESNAEILRATIEEILRKTNKQKVNIIAHSKGGIDARYLIWKYNFGDKIASLTTISTPHHGAEIADLIYDQKIIHSIIAKKALGVLGNLYGDKNPNMYLLNYQLTTEHMKQFNEKVLMDPRVYYQSIYTTMNSSFDDLVFFYTHWYINSKSGRNDGVVSEKSARWGNNIIEINGGISHAEIVDYKKKKISGVDIPLIYIDIVNELRKNNF
jgi:triacylglycerol lipase